MPAAELFVRIVSHVRERGLGLALIETGFVLSDDPPTVRGPDAAFIEQENLPAEGIPAGFWRVPPDLAVEILSPSNMASAIREKVLEYLAAGRGSSGSWIHSRAASPPTTGRMMSAC